MQTYLIVCHAPLGYNHFHQKFRLKPEKDAHVY